MKINKEQPTKKKSGMGMVLIALLMAFATQMAVAEERTGIIKDIRKAILGDGHGRAVLILAVDTTGNRIPDTQVRFPHPAVSTLSKNIELFAERGMNIVFDDNGHSLTSDGTIIDGFNTISIDGSNMLDLFPNEEEKFKFAAEARRRQQAAPAPAPQPSAEEQRIKELEAELERLRGGR